VASLLELQRAFAQGIGGGNVASIEGEIRGGGLPPAARLRIYRNLVRESALEALRSTYPVVERLVGERFFEWVAGTFLADGPSPSGDIEDRGAGLPEYLARSAEVHGLLYLSDVARLEWACHEVLRAPDEAPLDVRPAPSLDGVLELRLRLNPARRLFASDYPVTRIWQAHQQAGEPALRIDLAEGRTRHLILRRDVTVGMKPLSAGEFRLLEALDAGARLGEACEAALQTEPGLGLAAVLTEHLECGTFIELGGASGAPPRPPLAPRE
jgi:hypothetical protein